MYKVRSQSVSTEAVFTKTPMNDKWNIDFIPKTLWFSIQLFQRIFHWQNYLGNFPLAVVYSCISDLFSCSSRLRSLPLRWIFSQGSRSTAYERVVHLLNMASDAFAEPFILFVLANIYIYITSIYIDYTFCFLISSGLYRWHLNVETWTIYYINCSALHTSLFKVFNFKINQIRFNLGIFFISPCKFTKLYQHTETIHTYIYTYINI